MIWKILFQLLMEDQKLLVMFLVASDNLKQYLSSEFLTLMSNDQFLQALPGHLNYSL